MSVSAAWPFTVLPSSSSRTVTSAWASVPSVTAWIWNSGRPRLVRVDLPDRLEGGVDRPVAGRPAPSARTAVDLELELGRGADLRAALDVQADEADRWSVRLDPVVDQRHEILVEDLLLLVGQRLEADEGVVERVLAQLVAQLLELLLEGVAAGMLAHDQVRADQADDPRAA